MHLLTKTFYAPVLLKIPRVTYFRSVLSHMHSCAHDYLYNCVPHVLEEEGLTVVLEVDIEPCDAIRPGEIEKYYPILLYFNVFCRNFGHGTLDKNVNLSTKLQLLPFQIPFLGSVAMCYKLIELDCDYVTFCLSRSDLYLYLCIFYFIWQDVICLISRYVLEILEKMYPTRTRN